MDLSKVTPNAMQAVERSLGTKDPLKSSAGFSKEFQEKTMELEKLY